jgi:hypothetical protein
MACLAQTNPYVIGFPVFKKLGNGGVQLSCRNLTSRQIDQRGRISAIRSMNHVDAISALNNSPATSVAPLVPADAMATLPRV